MRFVLFVLLASVTALPCAAQTQQNGDQMSGMRMGTHTDMESYSLIDLLQQHVVSGTDAEPNSTPFEMLMTTKSDWALMLHGEGFLADIQQSGPKLFSTNWVMPMAQRLVGGGTLTLRTMLSLEPATISERRYPELFQEGETAFGLPLVDGQHPHNFFMELAAMYDYKIGEQTLLSVYAAPVGDPAFIRGGNWASMILWGRNQSLADGNFGNGYLLESTLQFLHRNFAWTRIENVDRTIEQMSF